MSRKILDERAKGEFKDWADLQHRVKGIGDKKAVKLTEAGLVVNGKGKEGMSAKPGKSTAKQEAKAKPEESRSAM